jgi:hypothetical protein
MLVPYAQHVTPAYDQTPHHLPFDVPYPKIVTDHAQAFCAFHSTNRQHDLTRPNRGGSTSPTTTNMARPITTMGTPAIEASRVHPPARLMALHCRVHHHAVLRPAASLINLAPSQIRPAIAGPS